RWKSAEATPEPPSAEFEVTVTVPLRLAAAAGAVIEPVGFVLSTRRLEITLEVVWFPTLSVATVRRSERASATPVVSNETWYGEPVAVAMVVQVPAPAGERWKATLAIPEPPSVAVLERVTVPRRFAPGSVRGAPVGVVVSMVTVRVVLVVVLPALSVVVTRRS